MNAFSWKNWLGTLTLASLTFGVSTGSTAAAEPLKVGYSNWSDVMATVNVAKYVLEAKLKQPVQLVNSDIGIQYQSIARSTLDVMLDGWMPVTHGAYVEKHKADLDDIGIIYTGGRNGWAVPAYIPESELSSIADLAKPAAQAKLGGSVQGIEPGGGLMRVSEKAIGDYGLDKAGYKLRAASEAGMLAALQRSYSSQQWIVVTAWSPHWLFQKWPMRYLKDPKGALGGEEQIHAYGSKQFAAKSPQAYAFIKNFKLELADVEAIEHAGETGKSYEVAAKNFVDAHPEKLKAWLGQ